MTPSTGLTVLQRCRPDAAVRRARPRWPRTGAVGAGFRRRQLQSTLQSTRQGLLARIADVTEAQQMRASRRQMVTPPP